MIKINNKICNRNNKNEIKIIIKDSKLRKN